MIVVMKKKYYKVQCHRCDTVFAFDMGDVTFVNINGVDNELIKCPCCNIDIPKYVDKCDKSRLNFTDISKREYHDIVKRYRNK